MGSRRMVVATIAVFVVLAAAEFIVTRELSPLGGSAEQRSAGVADIGGPFSMTNDLGVPVTQAALAGKPSIIYFGYTFCPEVCPTTLADLTRWIAQLGSNADKLNFVFVTVDPARDTPKVLHEYLSSFDPRIHGFSGTDAQLAQMAKAYKVYYKKEPADGSNYLMDHTSLIYLMHSDGSYAGFIPYQEKDDAAVAKLKALADKGGDV